MAFYAAIMLDVGQLPSKKYKRVWLTLFKSPPVPLMSRVALNRSSQENHPVQIEKNLISLCLGNVIRLFRCSPWKKRVRTWEGKVIGDMSASLCDDSSIDTGHMTQDIVMTCCLKWQTALEHICIHASVVFFWIAYYQVNYYERTSKAGFILNRFILYIPKSSLLALNNMLYCSQGWEHCIMWKSNKVQFTVCGLTHSS